MVNKKVVVICSMIAIIIVGLVVAFQIKRLKEIDYIPEETVVAKQNTLEEQNFVKNEEKEENSVEENKTITENITKENVTQTQVQGEEETKTEETEGNTENNNDKALRLVKKEWGEDDTVYYTIDNQTNNTYNVSVRSKATTATLAEYEVNVKEETVIIK